MTNTRQNQTGLANHICHLAFFSYFNLRVPIQEKNQYYYQSQTNQKLKEKRKGLDSGKIEVYGVVQRVKRIGIKD